MRNSFKRRRCAIGYRMETPQVQEADINVHERDAGKGGYGKGKQHRWEVFLAFVSHRFVVFVRQRHTLHKAQATSMRVE